METTTTAQATTALPATCQSSQSRANIPSIIAIGSPAVSPLAPTGKFSQFGCQKLYKAVENRSSNTIFGRIESNAFFRIYQQSSSSPSGVATAPSPPLASQRSSSASPRSHREDDELSARGDDPYRARTNSDYQKQTEDEEDDEECGRRSIASTPSPVTILSQIQSQPLHTQPSTKNKRKNFNPRCSAADEFNSDPTTNSTINVSNNSNSMNNENENVISNTADRAESVECDEKHPIDDATMITNNWQKLLTANCAQSAPINKNELITDTKSQISALSEISALDDIEGNKFYNIPNTNFSIAKTQAAFAAAAAAAATAAAAVTTSHNSANNIDADMAFQQRFLTARTTDAIQQFQQHQQTLLMNQQNLNITNDPQSQLQFACSAFNAVQELLNAYLPSISQSDIVDALKKQATVGKCAFDTKNICNYH